VALKESLLDSCSPLASGHSAEWREHLSYAIDHAAHLLPAQGPITVFIHHNTLHAFEHLPFDEAVRQGAEMFGCQPYLSEDRYRAELGRGRIRFDKLRAVLRDDLGSSADESIVRLPTRMELRLAMVEHPIWSGPAAELDYLMAETDALRQVRPDISAVARGRLIAEARRWVMRELRGRTGPRIPSWSAELLNRFGRSNIESWSPTDWEAVALESLWRVCLDGVAQLPNVELSKGPSSRHRDLIVRATQFDPDLWVHDLLIRYCASFLDQGVSHWPLPDRSRGLFRSFLQLYSRRGGPPDEWLSGLRGEATRLLDRNVEPLESVRESLELLGVPENEWEEYISATLLALRGWGGILRQVETRGDRVAHPVPPGTLVEFVAVRLLLDRLAAAHVAEIGIGYTGPLANLRDELRTRLPGAIPLTTTQRAFPIFQLSQVLGWAPDELHRLSPTEWVSLVGEIEGFSGIERRRVFHLAYEHRFRNRTLTRSASMRHIVGRTGTVPASRSSPAWTSAKNLSAGTSKRSRPKSRPSGPPGSSGWRCTTAVRRTLTSCRYARSSSRLGTGSKNRRLTRRFTDSGRKPAKRSGPRPVTFKREPVLPSPVPC